MQPDEKTTIPPGYALVPLEPTDAMRRAIWLAQYRHVNVVKGHNRPDEDVAALVEARVADPEQRAQDVAAWRAMVEAARG